MCGKGTKRANNNTDIQNDKLVTLSLSVLSHLLSLVPLSLPSLTHSPSLPHTIAVSLTHATPHSLRTSLPLLAQPYTLPSLFLFSLPHSLTFSRPPVPSHHPLNSPSVYLSGLSTGPHKQEPNDNIGNGPDRKMSLLSMVTSVLFLTVVGLSIHVSQIRQSKVTCNRTDNELNSTLQSMVSALNSNLSVLQQKHSDLRHQFCGLLTSRREFYRESCPRPRQFILDWKMRRRGSGLKCRVQCERWEVRMQ
ncbi:uncharacterized protein LOC132389589 isoform X1 [Hypanus sabinus]|uniref:uncharacterized protein LOC132389589 isoform X1 n=1 Tax=Hypanus sabinus TaxID=79690 RepID=UPI0028C3CDEE|nr:uncharacterized protein LOC132389589 isoform X1 [Hypanus sabinus]